MATRKKSPAVAGPRPYLTGADLAEVGQRLQDAAQQRGGLDYSYAVQAAAANRDNAQALRTFAEDTGRTDWAAAGRGLGQSSIRDAGLDAVQAAAANRVRANREGLALQAADTLAQQARIDQGLQTYGAAKSITAAENAAALPDGGAPAPASTAAGVPAAARQRRRPGAPTGAVPMRKAPATGYRAPARRGSAVL